MTPRNSLHRRVLCLSLTLFAGMTQQSPAQPAPKPQPAITELRVGFNGAYKLGCWTPLEVTLVGGTEAATGVVVITLPDTDGVPTRFVTPPNRPVGIQPQQVTNVSLTVRAGQANSSVRVEFISHDGKIRSRRTFRSGPEPGDGYVLGGLPSTNRLLLEYGPTLGITELITSPEELTTDLEQTRLARIPSATEWPRNWYDYEGVDTVVLTTSEADFYRPLLQNPLRIEALSRWVEMGGKVILFCGSQSEELLGPGGALEAFAPGEFVGLTRLARSQPLENFSGSEEPITPDRRLDVSVPELSDIEGNVLLNVGRGETQLPLVVRRAVGLGEVVFVGLDFDRPPLRDWPGRASFLRKVMSFSTRSTSGGRETNYYSGRDDLITTLRNSLDGKFEGVQIIPFAVVALLVIGYILLIGPGDYYLVSKIFRRQELTWITFPAIVLLVCALAYAYGNWMKGDSLRVNQVEIVDVDTTRALSRGTVWTHFFTPQVEQYHLALKPEFLSNNRETAAESVSAWLGLPGYVLGGMQSTAGQTSFFDAGYQFAPDLAAMHELPVQVWSTKTITARWSATTQSPFTANLEKMGEELVTGGITNTAEVPFSDVILLYGRWAYYIGELNPGTPIHLDRLEQPRTVRTMLTSATAGDITITQTAEDGTVRFHDATQDIARIVKVMMFYEAINGERYSNQLNRYQGFVDLSHLLKYEDRAILLARCDTSASQWYDDGQPLSSEQDRKWTYYRFVLPVE